MRFVLTFVTGIVVGYTLHVKKDQTIESVANGAVQFLEKRTNSVRDRLATVN